MVAAKWRYWTNFVWEKHNGGPRMHEHMPCSAHEHVVCYLPLDADVEQITFNGYESGEQGAIYKKIRNDISEGVYAKRKMTNYLGYAHPEGKRWIRSVLKGVSKTGMPLDDRTAHPTQKPLETVSRIVILLTNPGDLILDPFLGSGTTAHACKKLGRRCIGIEKSEAYLAMAIKRLQQEVMVFS